MPVVIAIKATFGVVAATIYAIAGFVMIDGAINTSGYAPGEGIEYGITICGAAITSFVAAQLGVAVAAPDAGNDGKGIVARLDGRSDASDGASRWTVGVLVFDVVVLIVVGVFFVWLLFSPGSIAVPDGANDLTEAPDYINLQAKAFIALVIAGAGGVGVAAAK